MSVKALNKITGIVLSVFLNSFIKSIPSVSGRFISEIIMSILCSLKINLASLFSFNNLEFSLGGDSTGLQGSIVQKYDYYGTRLEAGTYRVVLEMKAKDGTPHYLAAEFDVE